MHMPNVQDENEKRFTVTVFLGESQGNETFASCSEVESNDRELRFTDRNGKTHEFYGVGYHISEE